MLRRALPRTTLLAITLVGTAAALSAAPLTPRDGTRDYETVGTVSVRHGSVNVAGGNFSHARVDLALDTRLGPLPIASTYNSSGNYWIFNFDIAYQGGFFLDPSGAILPVGGIADGATVPGTVWVKASSTTIKSKGGQQLEFSPTTGRLLTLRWASAQYPQIRYTQGTAGGFDVTTDIRQCTSTTVCAVLFTIQYDAAGNVTQISDIGGRVAQYSYAGGVLMSARDGLDVARGLPGFRYEYSTTTSRLSAITTSENERTEFVTDSAGRLLAVTGIGAGNPTTSFSYQDLSGGTYSTTATDPRLGVSIYRVDGSRRLVSRQNQVGDLVSYAWNGLRPQLFTDAAGLATNFTYVDDDLVTIANPSGLCISFHYAPSAVNRSAPNSRPISYVNYSCDASTFAIGFAGNTYDSAGRLTETSETAGAPIGASKITYAYGSDEMVSQTTDPNLGTVYFQSYGVHGHPTQSSRDGTSWKTSSYDAIGNLLFAPSPRANSQGVVSRQFDGDRNVSARSLRNYNQGGSPASTVQQLTSTYRSDGKPLVVTPPYGGTTTWQYDALGRPLTATEMVSPGAASAPVARATAWTYDIAGNLASVELPNGMRQEFEYDAVGRQSRRRSLLDGAVESDVTFTYAGGRLTSAQDVARGLNETYGYDAFGRLALVTFSYGESVQLGYDAQSRVNSETLRLAGGAVVGTITRTFTLSGRELSLSFNGTVVRGRSYCIGFSCGSLVQTSYANSLVRKNYRTNGAPSGRELWRGSTRLEKSDYTISNNVNAIVSSQRVEVTNSGGTFNFATTENYEFESSTSPAGWDRRLNSGPSSLASNSNATFAFDHLSNLLSEKNGSTTRTFSFNAEHTRLLAASAPAAASYGYDEAGFETTRTVGGQVTTSSWNAKGELTTLTTTGFVVASIEYDALGRRRKMTANGSVRRWLFGGAVEATNADVPVAMDLGEVRIQFDGQHKFRHFDLRGNTKIRTDMAGNVVSHYRFDSYGLKNAVGVLDSDFVFAGGMRIVAGSNVFVLLGSRLLDTKSARFTSVDPVWNPLSRCAYTKGNPVDLLDPSGQSDCKGALTARQEAQLMREINVLSYTAAAMEAQGFLLDLAVVTAPAGLALNLAGLPLAGYAWFLSNQLQDSIEAREACEREAEDLAAHADSSSGTGTVTISMPSINIGLPGISAPTAGLSVGLQTNFVTTTVTSVDSFGNSLTTTTIGVSNTVYSY